MEEVEKTDQNITTQDRSHTKHIYISNVTSHYRITLAWVCELVYEIHIGLKCGKYMSILIKTFFVIIVNFTQIGTGKTSRLDTNFGKWNIKARSNQWRAK